MNVRERIPEDNWLLTIIRIPLQQQGSIPYITIPIGIITNNEIIVTVCYHSTEMIPDFIDHTRRKGIIVPNKIWIDFTVNLLICRMVLEISETNKTMM